MWNIRKDGAKPKKLHIKQNTALAGENKDSVSSESLAGEREKPSPRIEVKARSALSDSDDDSETKAGQVVSGSSKKTKDHSNDFHKSKRERSSDTSSSPERSQKIQRDIQSENLTSAGKSSSHDNKSYKSISDSLSWNRKHAPNRSSSPLSSTHRRRTPEKIPYFVDEVRERDRIRRKYGIVSNKPSLRSRRSRSNSRSRSYRSLHGDRSPNERSSHRRRSKSRDQYRSVKARDRSSVRYRHRSEGERERCSNHRSRYSRSYSRSRSRSYELVTRSHTQSSRSHRERHKYRHGEHNEASDADLTQRNLPRTQIITIPVPVPTDFLNYSYPSWPTTTQWTPHLAQPTRYGGSRAPFATILPPSVIPPMRHPFPPYNFPHPSIQYGARGLRLTPRYGITRPWQPNYRGRNP